MARPPSSSSLNRRPLFDFLLFLSFLSFSPPVRAGSITDELPPVLQRLKYHGDVDPSVIHRYEVHIDLNRANYEPDGPPSLPLRASALLGSEFLALVHPPNERSLDHPLATIAPLCDDADGGGVSCRIERYVVYEGRVEFTYALAYAEFSLPGMEDPDKLEKDDMGYPPPSKGATVEVEIGVLDGRDRGGKALEGIVDIISEMFGVKDPKTSKVEVERRDLDEEGMVGASESASAADDHAQGKNDEL